MSTSRKLLSSDLTAKEPQAHSWWRSWAVVPLAAGCVFVVAAIGAAVRETPTVDEFAHVPAGLLHWRHGQLEMYRNNPPLGKMWVAAPLAIDPSVQVPGYDGPGTGWDPWRYGMLFERQNSERYLSLMTRARLMTVPLVLLAALVVFRWSRDLFGEFAASIASALFLLSPTLLAHGHLATVDVAAMTTIVLAVFAVRWCGKAPSWQRAALAGAALGLALAVKFSALFLLPIAPALLVMWSWSREWTASAYRKLAGQVALYLLAAWLTVNASGGFAGTFDTVGSLRPISNSMRGLVERLPGFMPLLVPRAYVTGIDALQQDLAEGDFIGYLHGRWSREGWKSYYFIAYAIKESEPVVVLSLAALVCLFVVPVSWRERIGLLLAPATFLFIAAVLNSLCLGIRYVLPVFPFVFVMIGAVFVAVERLLGNRKETASAPAQAWRRMDRRVWIAAPLLLYAVGLTAFQFPAYLSYFNRFVGGPARGPEWLVDSNLDWGQDLYRLPELAREMDVDTWRLLYFGHVDPAQYGIRQDLPAPSPELAVYAVSVNYWKAMPYAVLEADGQARYLNDRVSWLAPFVPTRLAGSIAIFDLRASAPLDSATALYNAGLVRLVRGDVPTGLERLRAAVKQDPEFAKAHFYLGLACQAAGQHAEMIEALRHAVRLQPDWSEALNGLAWSLATSPDESLRDPAEAVRLAERAVQLAGRENLSYLDTLATALAAAGKREQALAVWREGLEKAQRAQQPQAVERFQKALDEHAAQPDH